MRMGWVFVVILVVLLGFSEAANAAFVTIGTANYEGYDYKLIYEDDNNGKGLVWLDYTRGWYNWPNQVDWASELGGSLTVNLYPGFMTTTDWSTGWRLPSAGGNPQMGYNQSSSEMGHLYYVSLGGLAGGPFDDTSPFEHLQPDIYYWSSTEYSPFPINVYYFYFLNGYQFRAAKFCNIFNAVAVHPAEISTVPMPGALWLFGSGLILGLLGLRRK